MLQQQTKKATSLKSGLKAAPQKAAKRRIKISKIKVVPVMVAGTVVETQY